MPQPEASRIMTGNSMRSLQAPLNAFTDAAAARVVRVIEGLQRDAASERAVRDSEHRAVLAELRECISAVAETERRLNERLASLRDGQDGQDGRDGQDGAAGPAGPTGERGEQGPAGEAGPRGERGEQGAPGRDGADGKDGRDGVDGVNGKDGAAGARGEIGPQGVAGPEGPPGQLPEVRAWTDAVHYQGGVVTHGGALWQARRDTGRSPPHEDWICIVAAGADGRSMAVRGTWSETETYRYLDVVTRNGGAFAAIQDDPGPCPSGGWQGIAAPGGKGDRGAPGERGPAGPPGLPVRSLEPDKDGLLTLTDADGAKVTGDLYPLLSKIAHR